MRESTRPDAEKVAVTAALLELAAATRDTSIDAGVLRIYMPHLDDYTTGEVVDACQHLERITDWFPKVAEIVKACSAIRQRDEVRDWFEVCGRLHQHACNGRVSHALQMRIDAGRVMP